ncbi:hypothetical protein OSB04_005367 [Centaurea solstitialis]|uniref:Uncharacterized protein n=1 Tax=Centaurea solstitialis TaxID=347529 RepID=A0AA38WGQ1_9ASTR|nr:hypothetical protein OSB04_005367 [Centaurea solstitialis]
MQGYEVGDRVHNFFAQENFFQGGYLPSDNNLWVSSQKEIGPPSFHTKAYDPEQSEVELRHNSLCVPFSNGFNFMQATATAEFTNDWSQGQHENINGYMYGHHVLHPGPNEAIFLGLDNVNQRGFLVNEFQQGGVCVSEQIPDSNRSYEIDTHGSLSFFGGQQQRSGFIDINLQRQLMLRKMQELQRQKDMQRLNTTQNSSVNQASPFARQPSSNGSRGLINVTPSSESSWADQSLFRVPISSSRGLLNSCPYASTDEASTQEMPAYGNQYGGIAEQVIDHDGTSVSRQGSDSWIKVEQIQQLTSVHQTGSEQGFRGPVSLIGCSQMAHDELAIEALHVAASQPSLDPDEERILFGSDENIWDAFGSDGNMGGCVSSFLNDNNEFESGLPSIQSGSWSALMQSAVAEASGSGVGLNFRNLEHPSARHPSTYYEDSEKQQAPLPDVNRLNASAMSFGALQKVDAAGNQLFGSSLPHNKQNDWKPVESIFIHDNHTTVVHEEIDQCDGIWRVNALSNFIVDPESTNTSMGSPHISGEGFIVNSAVATPNLSNVQGASDFGQFPINSHQVNYWKHVESSVRYIGTGNLRKPRVSESSFNSSDKEDLKMHEIESRSKRANSIDSYQSSSSYQVTSARLRESSSPNAGNLRAFGQMKFQYHPMGNLDEVVEMPYGEIQGTNTQPSSLQHFQMLRGQGNLGHTNVSSQGHVPDLAGITKESHGLRSKDTIGGHNIFAAFDKSVGLCTSEKDSQPSQTSSSMSEHCRSSKTFLNGSTDLSAQQQDFTTQACGVQLNLRKSSQLNVVESTSLSRQNIKDQQAENRGNLCRKVDQAQKTNGPHKEFHANPTATSEIDLKAFGRSLKPINLRHNYSSMNKKRAIRNTDKDPCNRVTKRPKVSDNVLGGQQHLVALRPKKRKLTKAGLHPWFVEVSGSFKNLQGIWSVPMKTNSFDSLTSAHKICTGAVEWSRATNWQMEKVDDDGDVTENVPRSKRRLIFTTLLMQQLFRPPLDSILSADASSIYESAVYYVGRLALGDACNLVSFASVSGANGLSEQSKESERIDDRRLLEAVEDFKSKARKLEDSFSRLDKIASVVNLKVEFEDLERFSIINRLARFHGRMHADGAKTSSIIFPRKYVTAFALPANLPDRVRCLSL